MVASVNMDGESSRVLKQDENSEVTLYANNKDHDGVSLQEAGRQIAEMLLQNLSKEEQSVHQTPYTTAYTLGYYPPVSSVEEDGDNYRQDRISSSGNDLESTMQRQMEQASVSGQSLDSYNFQYRGESHVPDAKLKAKYTSGDGRHKIMTLPSRRVSNISDRSISFSPYVTVFAADSYSTDCDNDDTVEGSTDVAIEMDSPQTTKEISVEKIGEVDVDSFSAIWDGDDVTLQPVLEHALQPPRKTPLNLCGKSTNCSNSSRLKVSPEKYQALSDSNSLVPFSNGVEPPFRSDEESSSPAASVNNSSDARASPSLRSSKESYVRL